MIDLVQRRSDQSTIRRYAYGYDDAGRRIWVLRANGRGDVYRYDATDQLTNVLYEALNPQSSPTGWTNEARYAFDPACNRMHSPARRPTSWIAGLNGSLHIFVPWRLWGWDISAGCRKRHARTRTPRHFLGCSMFSGRIARATSPSGKRAGVRESVA